MQSRIQVLVVDDESIVRICCERALAGTEYDLTLASNGREGLEAMRGREFDVIITDLKMPNMNGFEFIEQARAIKPGAVFVMTTGHATENTARKAAEQGLVYLEKPFCPGGLMKAIEEAKAKIRKAG